MFERRAKIFRLLGFDIYIDISWIIVALLVTWSLAEGAFPYYYRNFSHPIYWYMGMSGAVGLFLSIIAHELSHAVVARKCRFQIKAITLFIFGGVAEMDEEPPSPQAEFYMAIAGPIASIVIGAVFFGFASRGLQQDWFRPMVGVLWYLGWTNWMLATFNIIPAFPLDGGRVMRAGLWHWKKDIYWATKIATQCGNAFSFVLGLTGTFFIYKGNFTSGLWWLILGMFLSNASTYSYKQLLQSRHS